MPQSRGKKFEAEVSKMLQQMVKDGRLAHYHRPVDVPPGQRARFTSRSPIDFYAYRNGGAGLVIECKAMKSRSLSHSRLPAKGDGDVDLQWDVLYRCWSQGVETIVLLNYYGYGGRDGQRGKAFIVPFKLLVERWVYHADHGGRKSWPLADFADCPTLRKVAESWEWMG